MNKRECGNKYEAVAANTLTASGYTVLQRNYRCRIGEIDIIAQDRDVLVFVEVKYRLTDASGYPEESVSYTKQRKISATADYYCMKHGITDEINRRFDVIAIDSAGIRHYENAFMYVEAGRSRRGR